MKLYSLIFLFLSLFVFMSCFQEAGQTEDEIIQDSINAEKERISAIDDADSFVIDFVDTNTIIVE